MPRPIPANVWIPGSTFHQEKEYLKACLVMEAAELKENYCRNFAMFANFAGWKWRDSIPTHADICGTYDSLVNNLVDFINKIGDDDLRGTKWHASVGTGRINISILYYVNSHNVQVQINALID